MGWQANALIAGWRSPLACLSTSLSSNRFVTPHAVGALPLTGGTLKRFHLIAMRHSPSAVP